LRASAITLEQSLGPVKILAAVVKVRLKDPPFFWAGPELAKRVLRGESPLLSDKQVRQANADGGLNLVTWAGALHADFLQSVEANTAILAAFVGEHRGFFLREVVGHGMSVEALEGLIRSGIVPEPYPSPLCRVGGQTIA
jgi:hypothetical protein